MWHKLKHPAYWILVLLTYLGAVSTTFALYGGDFVITWHTIDAGGGRSEGGGFTVTGTFAQHDTGTMEGSTLRLRGGYWSFLPCPADFAGNDRVVNVTDLLELLGSWGVCPACPSDINDDGVVNVTDLLSLLANWGPCS